MGPEGPKKPTSIDDIIAGIESGEITPGDKGWRDVMLPDGTQARYNIENQTLQFALNGIVTEAVVREGNVVNLELTDQVKGKAVYDIKIQKSRRSAIQAMLDSGELELK